MSDDNNDVLKLKNCKFLIFTETGSGVLVQCPGGDLESCVDVCPGNKNWIKHQKEDQKTRMMDNFTIFII